MVLPLGNKTSPDGNCWALLILSSLNTSSRVLPVPLIWLFGWARIELTDSIPNDSTWAVVKLSVVGLSTMEKLLVVVSPLLLRMTKSLSDPGAYNFSSFMISSTSSSISFWSKLSTSHSSHPLSYPSHSLLWFSPSWFLSSELSFISSFLDPFWSSSSFG